jgi:RimJ/RimL family protein N-acetyltransferase
LHILFNSQAAIMAINSISSNRLRLEPLSAEDGNFIYELVNSDGWLKFIGDRNVKSINDAHEYIANILSSETVSYWVVKLTASGEKLGVITLIQKDYLDHPDIGFAFLPQFAGKGYAYESANELLNHLRNNKSKQTILACTLPENTKSIRLLERLGLVFSRKIGMLTLTS